MSQRQSRQSRTRIRVYRARMRRKGLRLVQVWLPDVRNPWFVAEARRQSLLVSRDSSEREIADFLEHVADLSGWKA